MTLCRDTSYRYGGGQCWHRCTLLLFFLNVLRWHRLGRFLSESAFALEHLLRHYAKWAFIQEPNSVMVGLNFVQHRFTSMSKLKTISRMNIQWLSRWHWISIFPFYLHIYHLQHVNIFRAMNLETESRALSVANWVTHSIMILFSCFHVPEWTNKAFKNPSNPMCR